METRIHQRGRRRAGPPGFTLIELMVVIAIVALLVAILMPSLQSARDHSKTMVCGTNLHNVGLALSDYLYVSNSVYPPSYAYPENKDGDWSTKSQPQTPQQFGYLHWSYFLYDSGKVNDDAFQCPKMQNGGAPRTNPGLKPENWELGSQIDSSPDVNPNDLEDKQAPRMAYTANAAIMPRNKFTKQLSGGQRVNVLITENRVTRPGNTISVTEFLDNWKALGRDPDGSGHVLSSSHRPVNPFYHVGSAFNEYQTTDSTPGFIYGVPSDQQTYGLLPYTQVRDKTNILDRSSGVAQINAVGRHHPTGDSKFRKKFGGSANFLFCDGHVENMTVLETVQNRKWGDRYYSLSGENQIMNMSPPSNGRP